MSESEQPCSFYALVYLKRIRLVLCAYYLTDSILIITCAYNIMNSANEKAGALKVEPSAKISTANILLTNPRELKGTRWILKGNENSRIC